MADSAQSEAAIQLDSALSFGEDDRDVLLATGILGQEAISRPFVYTLTVLSRDFAIAPGKILGTAIGIRIRTGPIEQKVFRGYHGFVAGFSAGPLHPKREEFRTYSLRVVPWLAMLDQGSQYRIFQDKTALDVIRTVLGDAVREMFRGANAGLFFDLRAQPGPRFPVLQFCVQYDETDFNFVSRLMEQHGLHYFFEQSDHSHVMVIVEGPPYKAVDQTPLSFVPSTEARGVVSNWTHSFVPRLKRWTSRDRDYRLNPPVYQKSEETVLADVARSTEGDHVQYPGGTAVLVTPGEESAYAQILLLTRLQEDEARFEVFHGNTTRVTLAAGRRMRVVHVKEEEAAHRLPTEEDRDYLITTVNFSATETAFTGDKTLEVLSRLLHDALIAGVSGGQDSFKDAKGNLPDVNKAVESLPKIASVAAAFGAGFAAPLVPFLLELANPVLSKLPVLSLLFPKPPKPERYTNSFTAVPLGNAYRSPSLTPRPQVRGPQTAIVFGQTKEEVETDELGRIRVKFDWDRTTKGGADPETNSCFLRVVQGWAGPKWGMQFMPRVGEEVLVDFLDGDPDRPIITGRVYNALHKPPFELPKYKLQSGLKTRSVPLGDKAKDRYHMLRFDDTANKEQVLLRSQKRLDIRAFGSTYETTSGSRFAHIGYKDPDADKQGGDFDITVGNDYQLHVNGGHFERVEKDLNLTVHGKMVQDLQSDAAYMVKGTASVSAGTIILEAKQKISLKVGGNAIVIDPAGVTIIGTLVKINSGGQGTEAPDADIEDPVDAAVSDTGEPGWLEHHRGGPGGGRRRRHLSAQHYIAPPRPGENPAMTALRNRLNQTPTGRNAVNVFDRDNVTFVPGTAGQGTFYTPPYGAGLGNTVTLDPTDQSPASTFAHEMNHADAQHSGLTPDPTKMSRADYINARMAEDAHGEAIAQREHNELAGVHDPEPGTGSPFTRGVYDAAAQQGEADYRAAHPDATPDEIKAAGEQAGENRINQSYQNGLVQESTPPNKTYNQRAGEIWDAAHPPPPPHP